METKSKIMKAIYLFFGISLILLTASCQIDNYDEPDALFTGRITYNGDPVMVGANQVRFQLYQPGYGNSGPFDVWVDLDGSYSGRLSSGEIKLKFLDGQGPFKAPADTIFISLNGNTDMDLEVQPYYMVRNPQFSKSNNTVNATVSVEKVLMGADGRDIEAVTLFINRTAIVSNTGDYNIAQNNGDFADPNNVNLAVNIPDNYDRSYIFARVGVKIAGVEDLIFSPVERLDL